MVTVSSIHIKIVQMKQPMFWKTKYGVESDVGHNINFLLFV